MPEAGLTRGRRMRVLWTHNFDPDRLSSQVYLQTAAEGLRRHGVDLELEYLGNLRSIPNLLAARTRVSRLAPDFDIVHAQYGSATGLATAAVQGTPKVLSIRGNDWSTHDETFGFYYAHTRLARAMTRWAAPRYDCLLPVSHRLADEVRRTYTRCHVMPLPSPVDVDRFVPRDRLEARAAAGQPDGRGKWILFNALNLDDPIKRFPLARAAFEIANARRGDLQLRVATNLSHDRLPLFVAACDLALCTSETEGWPNGIKEALACNVPFVATDVSDLRDIARQDPACRVCPPDPRAIADAICDVLDAPAPPDVRRHVEPLSVQASTTRLVGIYETVLARCDRA